MGLSKTRATRMKKSHRLPAFLTPLSTISPTAFCAIRECALKEVWRRNGNPPLLPASPKARVGTISHRILAEAGQGRIDADEAATIARWHELVSQANSEINSYPLERHLAPLENSVPDMEVRRIRTTRNALVIARQARSIPRSNERSATPAPYGHEIPVRSTDGLVRGTIDQVVREGSTDVIIRDYKSGALLESDGGGTNQPKEAYQLQLKMYARLYAETFGQWPTSLELVSLAGESQKIPFTKNDCSNLLDEARASLRIVNEKVAEHSEDSLPAILAKPTPQACAFCRYRPACGPYRLATADPSQGRWPTDVMGTVESVAQLGNSRMMLELTTSTGSVKIPGLSPGARHPVLSHLQPGELAGAYNLRRSRLTGPYSESPLTTIHKLEEVLEGG